MNQIVNVLKALSDETRLRILNLLYERELCVCDVMVILQISQAKASRHLIYLKNAGLVKDRKHAQWAYYSLSNNKHLKFVDCTFLDKSRLTSRTTTLSLHLQRSCNFTGNKVSTSLLLLLHSFYLWRANMINENTFISRIKGHKAQYADFLLPLILMVVDYSAVLCAEKISFELRNMLVPNGGQLYISGSLSNVGVTP